MYKLKLGHDSPFLMHKKIVLVNCTGCIIICVPAPRREQVFTKTIVQKAGGYFYM
jgi:hypothetical protein